VAWPDEPFWDYSLALYGRPGVEAACLELQRRHGLDVNLVLWCLWLGTRGVALDPATMRAATTLAGPWQVEVVRPLRAVRRRLKATLADTETTSLAGAWPLEAGAIRARVLDLELDAEHLEQLALGRLAAGLAPSDAPADAAALHNLAAYWRFDERDRHALSVLLDAALPGFVPAALETLLLGACDPL